MRKPRADSLRNRVHLLEIAKAAFTQVGADVPLEEIARRASVGIGTLYRHFPTRDALLAAVYQREVEQLAQSADTLLASRRAGEALEAWLHLLVDYMATKRVIVPALQASVGEGTPVYAATGATITDAMGRLVQAAIAAGDIRSDVGIDDVYRAMIGVSYGYEQPGWEPGARRLISILMAGLKSQA
ncbi:TetR/AcrR family transcriptional regulator [Caulobacter sp. NIBR2454]|uniref:TetR/AcrR family transcriptional regulator n=1 Tax=Caulobacter sp. NIBR2454 TaxID=3015996 RepID=UPI0022B61AE7|nr:TetR/AcrR family transcriptional regulator [Caulobacter sp. NIBR2454]